MGVEETFASVKQQIRVAVRQLIERGDDERANEFVRVINQAIQDLGERQDLVEFQLEWEFPKLIAACLKTEQDTEAAREKREIATRGARAILLRVESEGGSQPNRLPRWVHGLVFSFALGAFREDTERFQQGEPPLAVDLGRMMCANIATFTTEDKQDFGELLKILCKGPDEWRDPFITDRLFILGRILFPELLDLPDDPNPDRIFGSPDS